MKKLTLSQAVARSRKIREAYHQLELKHHGREWTVEEDALAFLTDAGLVGRLTMAQQGRWPVEKGAADGLEHKIGECLWWLMELARRMEIDAESALETFLTTTEQQLEGSMKVAPKRKVKKKHTKL
ncbi:MazG-like protein [Brevifollis gellanilyticus]|uniref:30S ribosomal protein S15 n=1 Tax=Brevifollis gellanilyticus TaxID=748831 RepID=A0A512MHZ9_9BACT|nr:MazG-like protein [Brevifollis gellanilyticus]GEP46367.1 30S ribosomal protein S15 [Brevifollis gellanilyticus]